MLIIRKIEFTRVLKNFKKSFVLFMILNILLGQFLYAGKGLSKCQSPLPERELVQQLKDQGIDEGGWEIDKNELRRLTILIQKEKTRFTNMFAEFTDCAPSGFCSYYAEEVAIYFRDGKSIFTEEKKFNRLMKKFNSYFKKNKISGRFPNDVQKRFANSTFVMYKQNLNFAEDIMQKFRSGEYKQALISFMIRDAEDANEIGHMVNVIPLKIGDDIHPLLFDSLTGKTELIGKGLTGSVDHYLMDMKEFSMYPLPPTETDFSRGFIFTNYLIDFHGIADLDKIRVRSAIYIK